ncbi:MAG: hypothetical protein AAF383_05145 [Cyanobacteria bacterium P01_A01_bin.83]
MFASRTKTIDFNRGKKFYLTENNHLLDYGRVLNLWQNDKSFRSFFIDLLAQVSFAAYRWETPNLTINNLDQIFEFVLLDSPRLIKIPNPSAFGDYLNSSDSNDIVVFPNLGGDALLVVPSLQSSISAYGHLATFIREAPESQQHSLWQKVGQQMQQRVCDQPIWLNTAGAGVPWLHIRLDSQPKYYGYQPYRQAKVV